MKVKFNVGVGDELVCVSLALRDPTDQATARDSSDHCADFA